MYGTTSPTNIWKTSLGSSHLTWLVGNSIVCRWLYHQRQTLSSWGSSDWWSQCIHGLLQEPSQNCRGFPGGQIWTALVSHGGHWWIPQWWMFKDHWLVFLLSVETGHYWLILRLCITTVCQQWLYKIWIFTVQVKQDCPTRDCTIMSSGNIREIYCETDHLNNQTPKAVQKKKQLNRGVGLS